jgi:threonine/homoserine/homoserine lactone efflux protein
MNFILQGLILGFSIAAPVGPIGVLCIRRTLAEGKLSGFVSGLGAATADALYGSIAAFGLTAVSAFLLRYTMSIQLVGGLFLLYLAVRTFFAQSSAKTVQADVHVSLITSYVSTLFLTLTNPTTILSFIALFAGLGLAALHTSYSAAGMLVGGVFAGSALWWFLLSGGVSLLREKFDAKALVWVNRISGILIFLLGLFSLVSSMHK